MIEVKESDASRIKFPVGRKGKRDGSVVIFWDEHTCTVTLPGESYPNAGLTCGGLISCMDENTWEPVDIHIFG
jgi:hypothetical protein